MVDDIIESALPDLNKELGNCIELCREEAQSIVDEYYEWLAEQNKQILNLKSMGEAVKTGNIGPFSRVHAENNKLYLYWVAWPITSVTERKRLTKVFAKKINPYSRGYTKAQFERLCPEWMIEKIMSTEADLVRVRDISDTAHSTQVKFNKLIKNTTTK